MEIEVLADRKAGSQGELVALAGYEVVAGLGACADRVAGALVALSEERASGRPVPRLRCQLEVRPRGHAPLAVSRVAATGDAALRGAVEDMRRVLERMFRRVDSHRGW